MNKSLKNLAVIVIILIFVMSCGIKKPLTDLSPKPNEGIVAGRIKIYYNGHDVTKKTIIQFNQSGWGKYSYKVDTSRIILTRLPLGEGHISQLNYGPDIFCNIPREQSRFQIKDNLKINYIGDIIINWKGPWEGQDIFGLIAPIGDRINQPRSFNLYVLNNMNNTTKIINERFDTKIEYREALINAPKPGNKIIEELKKYDENKPEYLIFHLKSKKKVDGYLLLIDSNALYVENKKGDTLFVLLRKSVLKIHDKNGKDKTHSILNIIKKGDIYYEVYPRVIKLDH